MLMSTGMSFTKPYKSTLMPLLSKALLPPQTKAESFLQSVLLGLSLPTSRGDMAVSGTIGPFHHANIGDV